MTDVRKLALFDAMLNHITECVSTPGDACRTLDAIGFTADEIAEVIAEAFPDEAGITPEEVLKKHLQQG